jgi:hypothetical protein
MRWFVQFVFSASLLILAYSTVATASDHATSESRQALSLGTQIPEGWDRQFGQQIGCNSVTSAVAALPDGRLVIAGEFTVCGDVATNRIAIWDPANKVFQKLGTGVTGVVHSIAIDGDDIFVGGSTSGFKRFNISTGQWHPVDGSTNGPGGDVYAIDVVGDDVYVGGNFLDAGGVPAKRIARFNRKTRTWSALGTGQANGVEGDPGSRIDSILVHDGYLYAGGFFRIAGDVFANNLARFDLASQRWEPLGSNTTPTMDGHVNSLVMAGSRLFVGGYFTTIAGISANRVAQYDLITRTWSALGAAPSNGANDAVEAMHEHAGEIYVSGLFNRIGGLDARGFARFNIANQAWSNSCDADGFAGHMTSVGDLVYVATNRAVAGPTTVNWIAACNVETDTWSTLGVGASNGLDDDVHAFAKSGSNLFVGGSFGYAGGVPINHVARFDLNENRWAPLGSGNTSGVNGSVRSIAAVGDSVFIGGDFSSAAGILAQRIVRHDLLTGEWHPLGTGSINGVANEFGFDRVWAILPVGGDIYVGGAFTSAGGVPAHNIAKFNPTSGQWTSLGAGVRGSGAQVMSLAHSNGNLFVGGIFSTAGGMPVSGIARFNIQDQTWSPLEAGGNSIYTEIRVLYFVGPELFAGGSFTSIGGVNANRIARYNPASGLWSAVGNGLANGVGQGRVSALALRDRQLIIGGIFTSAGGRPVQNIAAFDLDTQSWGNLGPTGADGVSQGITYDEVMALTLAGDDLFVGGKFMQAGSFSSYRLARFGPSLELLLVDGFDP